MKSAIYLIILSLLAVSNVQAMQCSDLLNGQRAQTVTVNDIDSPEAFFEAMTKGMILGPEQEGLFGFYRTVFGNPSTNVGKDLKAVHAVLDKHPTLLDEQVLFREVNVSQTQKKYPVSEDLRSFVSSLLKSSGQTRSNLFNIDANLGFWRKIIMPPLAKGVKLSTEERQALNRTFHRRLNALIPKTTRDSLKDTNSDNFIANATTLVSALIKYEAWLVKREKSQAQIGSARQAIVDTLHSAPFFNAALVGISKSVSGLDVISALSKLMDLRDEIAMESGFEGHFVEVVEKYNSSPTGLDPSTEISILLRDFEMKTQDMPFEEVLLDTVRVRPLSIMESPFRSCLGGSDCSSRTYFEKALDPNFYYFTVTQKDYSSSGHVTIVLGEAKDSSGETVRTAFIDKIQNIDNANLSWVLEALRHSVAEQGYTLVLPADVGDHNGLSNVEGTRSFVRTEIISPESKQLVGFEPFQNQYSFENRYSAAYNKPTLTSLRQVDLSGIQLELGSLNPNFKAPDNLSLESLIGSIIELASSTREADLLSFISLARSIQHLEQYGLDPSQYWMNIERIFNDTDSSAVKKQSLYALLIFQNRYNLILNVDNYKTDFYRQVMGEIIQWGSSSDELKVEAYKVLASTRFEYDSGDTAMDSLKSLLEYPLFDINSENSKGATPLLEAILNNDLDLLTFILSEKNIDVNASTDEGATPLAQAILNGDLEIVKLLLSAQKIDFNGKPFSGNTQFQQKFLAQGYGNILTVMGEDSEALFAEIPLAFQNSSKVVNAMSIMALPALKLGESTAVTDLLKFVSASYVVWFLNSKGLNTDSYWMRVEEIFKTTEDPELKKHSLFALLSIKLKVALVDQKYFSPDQWQLVLEEIYEWRNTSDPLKTKAYETLSSHIKFKFAVTNIRDVEGINALKSALGVPWFNSSDALKSEISDENLEAVRLILESKYVDVNSGLIPGKTQVQDNSRTPLDIAILKKNIEIIKLLLDHPDIIPNYANRNLHSPLTQSFIDGSAEVVELLLSHPKVNVNESGLYYQVKPRKSGYNHSARMTLLELAFRRKNLDLVDKIMKHPSFDVNWRQGQNSLLRIVVYNQSLVKAVLYDPDFDISVLAEDTAGPIFDAERYGLTSTARLMKARLQELEGQNDD